MSMLDSLRKGFSFLLMSFGISSPSKKAAPQTGAAVKKTTGK